MKKICGNIWDFYDNKKNVIVIPTNLGWTRSGYNVMGRGIAKQSSVRFPTLQFEYGSFCKSRKESLLYFDLEKLLLLFPTKPLIKETPHLSWKQNSDLNLIKEGLREFLAFASRYSHFTFYVPLLGCGNGGLNQDDVLPVLEKELSVLNNVYLVVN